MSRPEANILVLGLGNDIMGDDGVGLAAARMLKEQAGASVNVVETSECGLALLELLEGYDKALLLDAVMTGSSPPGTILEFGPEDFDEVVAPSPHYAGLSEVLNLADRLAISFPSEIRVLAMEVESAYEIREGLSDRIQECLAGFVGRARDVLNDWQQDKVARRP